MLSKHWARLRIFQTVAEAGSFSSAADTLNVHQTAISRHINNLEGDLNTKLFYRHSRGLVMTREGEILLKAVNRIHGCIREAEAQIADTSRDISGSLVVSTAQGLGTIWLVPRIKPFLDSYPRLNLRLLFSDTPLDLNTHQADVAIRILPPHEGNLISSRLGSVRFRLFASRAYLSSHAPLEKPEHLSEHRVIVLQSASSEVNRHLDWIRYLGLTQTEWSQCPLLVSNVYAVLMAVKSGVGVGALPEYAAEVFPGLECVLPDHKIPGVNIHFVHADDSRKSRRIKVFRQFLVDEFSDKREDQHGQP